MDLQTFTNNKIKYLIVRNFNKKYFSLVEYFFSGHSRTNSKKLKNSRTFKDKIEIQGLSRTFQGSGHHDGVQRTEFFVILDRFLPFYSPNSLKNQNFEKMKKITWRCYPFTQVFHKWLSWCIVPETSSATDNFLSFWTIFCPFTPYQLEKSILWKNKKKTTVNVILLHRCTLNDNHMMYGFWDTKHDRQKFLLFWAIFCPFTPLTT